MAKHTLGNEHPELTERQSLVLSAIEKHVEKFGTGPVVGWLCQQVDEEHNTVKSILSILAQKGLIERQPATRPGGIVLVDNPERHLRKFLANNPFVSRRGNRAVFDFGDRRYLVERKNAKALAEKILNMFDEAKH